MAAETYYNNSLRLPMRIGNLREQPPHDDFLLTELLHLPACYYVARGTFRGRDFDGRGDTAKEAINTAKAHAIKLANCQL